MLDDLYQYHLPPVRRIPPLLWSRIRADLPGYLSERAADGVIVLNWFVANEEFAACQRCRRSLLGTMTNFVPQHMSDTLKISTIFKIRIRRVSENAAPHLNVSIFAVADYFLGRYK